MQRHRTVISFAGWWSHSPIFLVLWNQFTYICVGISFPPYRVTRSTFLHSVRTCSFICTVMYQKCILFIKPKWTSCCQFLQGKLYNFSIFLNRVRVIRWDIDKIEKTSSVNHLGSHFSSMYDIIKETFQYLLILSRICCFMELDSSIFYKKKQSAFLRIILKSII